MATGGQAAAGRKKVVAEVNLATRRVVVYARAAQVGGRRCSGGAGLLCGTGVLVLVTLPTDEGD